MSNIFYNKEYRREFKKSDCPEDMGSYEEFVVPEAQFCSDISQTDADNKAARYAEMEGPLFARKVGSCCNVYYNDRQEGDFYSNVCPEGYKQENPYSYTVKEGRYFSMESKEDANYKAKKFLQEEGQRRANLYGECHRIFWNEEQHGWYSRQCREGWKGPERYRHIDAGVVYSFISINDANIKAKARLDEEAQDWVNRNTECEPDRNNDCF